MLVAVGAEVVAATVVVVVCAGPGKLRCVVVMPLTDDASGGSRTIASDASCAISVSVFGVSDATGGVLATSVAEAVTLGRLSVVAAGSGFSLVVGLLVEAVELLKR